MSPAERSVRHGKLRTDRAISQAYIRLAADVRARAIFNELLRCIRDRSPRLLDAPVINREFWRTVWLFLVANSGSIDGAQVGPIIDFVHVVRTSEWSLTQPRASELVLDTGAPNDRKQDGASSAHLDPAFDTHESGP